jgi:hypothetical protein
MKFVAFVVATMFMKSGTVEGVSDGKGGWKGLRGSPSLGEKTQYMTIFNLIFVGLVVGTCVLLYWIL